MSSTSTLDVRHMIQTIKILNIDTNESTIDENQIALKYEVDNESYIVSDADEELLILIEFKKRINLHSIKLHAISQTERNDEISPPKQVHIFKLNDLSINFDDIRSIKADKSIICSSKKLVKGQNINLKSSSQNTIKFKKTKFIAIYIETNQNDTENTFINAVTLKGKVDDIHQDKKIIIKNQKDDSYINISNNKMNDVEYHFDKSDSQNKQKLKELGAKIHENASINNIDSNYLFDPIDIHPAIQSNTNQCELQKCQCMDKISNILRRYNLYIQHGDDDDDEKSNTINQEDMDEKSAISIDVIYDSDYKEKHLLNDFNHLLFCHSDQFEDIYNILIKKCNNNTICNLSTCLILRRNNRDRSTENNDLYLNKNDQNAVIKQQLIDRIHSYWFHSFDTGYRMTRNEKRKIIDEEIKYENDDIPKTDIDPNVIKMSNWIKSKHRMAQSDKFILKFDNQQKDTDYSYGARYFYWKHYENNFNVYDEAMDVFKDTAGSAVVANADSTLNDWYIPNKYQHFKDELLNNELCVISLSKWDILVTKAKCYINTDHVRGLKCAVVGKYATVYQLETDQIMSIFHLIAMMTYCNFTTLQRIFSETFRHKDKDETNEEMKMRHKNYHYLARYLRECVDCFGMERKLEPTQRIDLYHGVNTYFSFSSLYAFIRGPLSTTTDYVVAANFCGNKGMIINMQTYVGSLSFTAIGNFSGSTLNRLKGFDCCWISDYVAEREIFFIGGTNKLTINSIIKAPSGINYNRYITALQQMTYSMSNGDVELNYNNIPCTLEEEQLVFRLLSHELYKYYPNDPNAHPFKSCPDYIKNLLHKHCKNITTILFKNLGDDYECRVHQHLFKYDNGWIKIDLICKMFQNMEIIAFNAQNMNQSFCKQISIYNSILHFIEDNKNNTLHGIQIRIVDEIGIFKGYDKIYVEEMREYINSFKTEFNKYGWSIEIKETKSLFLGGIDIWLENKINLMKRNDKFQAIMQKHKT